MDAELLRLLREVTPEEQKILDGTGIDRKLYTGSDSFTVESGRMLANGELIRVRTHTRFTGFPRHKHNYIEIMYMCEGSTTHIIDGQKEVVLRKGDLLFLNQHAYHEILPTGEGDIGVNFIVLPEFFDTAFRMISGENVLTRFLLGVLRQSSCSGKYLHFKVAGVLPVQNLVENMVYALVYHQGNEREINQTSMGLLFLQLLNFADRIEESEENQYENMIAAMVMKYIEEHYRGGTLAGLADMLNQSPSGLSRFIKQTFGATFKDMQQRKRFQVALELLCDTTLPVSDIVYAVGYENSSYFYRLFREKYQISPREYRAGHSRGERLRV